MNLEDFPTARRVTYLNSASISLMPRPAVEGMVEFQRKIAMGGTIGFDEEAETEALEKARCEAATLLGAHEDEVGILSSATDGICSLAWSLDIKGQANVVSTDADFPSVVYPWTRLGQERDLEVRLAKNREGLVSEEELEQLVDDRTGVISISHVEYGTGQKFNLRWLSELAHAHGALLVVDATQSAGLVPIDVKKDGIDALVASGYKGLLGPFGAAVLYVRQELAEGLRPSLVGWRSTPVPFNLDATALSYASGVKKFEYGTMSYASSVGLAESMHYLRRAGHANVTRHVLSLTKRLIDAVRNDPNLPSCTVLTPGEEDSHSSIASFRFTNRDQSAISAGLQQRNVIVSPRFNGVRFSFHIYNMDQDIERAVQALKELLSD